LPLRDERRAGLDLVHRQEKDQEKANAVEKARPKHTDIKKS
jgi:hypothetical protein